MSNGTVITIGVYGYSAESFGQAVIDARPDVFVDIRRRRGVRGHDYSFANSQRLQDMLAQNDIPYVHRLDLAAPEPVMKREGELDKQAGIARHNRDSLSDAFVTDYTNEVLSDFDADAFIDSLGHPKRVLLMCVEKTAAACHRGLVAQAIADQLGWHREDMEP